jgi:hypothetical protein
MSEILNNVSAAQNASNVYTDTPNLGLKTRCSEFGYLRIRHGTGGKYARV